MTNITNVACVGAGVIGAGWTARLLLNGIDVALFDPAPQTESTVAIVLSAAERACAELFAVPLRARGTLRICHSLAEAVTGAELIQESVPERQALKQDVLAQISDLAPVNALIASSSSGLLPSELQRQMTAPERFLVAHPYNPVYLLPLVEIVGGQLSSATTLEHAKVFYAAIGMKTVVLDREIEAFIGDRLLEALWREALWLVKDDIASVEQIDDVIRHSFGLRWAQMGLFQTYRMAGGEDGMKHFLQQFGPSLQWPWSRLTDVPELDEALVDKISRQSDQQNGAIGIRELEDIRDANLVGILQALRSQDAGRGWGAGQQINRHEQLLRERQAGQGVDKA